MTMLEKDLEEITNDEQVITALKEADHFYITFFNKSKAIKEEYKLKKNYNLRNEIKKQFLKT